MYPGRENIHSPRSCFSHPGFWLIFVSLLAAPGRDLAQPALPEQAIDSIFARWNSPASPGCALGIIRDGKLVYSQGYGMASLEDSVPNSANSLFDIGSMSKQFTAACVLMLAHQHKLSLDDDVRKYVPELPDYGERISIRHLLNHTSGLRDYITLIYYSGVHVEDLETTREALGMIMRQKALNFPPGDEWSYSNTGYLLASLVVERVSGISLPEFAKRNFFDPLGMTHTVWVNGAGRVLANLAEGYSDKPEGGFQRNMSDWELVGDGGIRTTVGDLVMWDRNFYSGAAGGESLFHELTTPGTLNSGKKLGYGLGFFLETYKGLDVVRHEGEWAGYKSELLRIPSEHFSVICLCNLHSMNPTWLAERVVDKCLAGAFPAAPAPAGTPRAGIGTALPTDPADASRWTGYYRNPSDETIRLITLRNDTIVYNRVPGAATPLLRIGPERFTMLGVPNQVVVRFTGGPSTHATGMDVVVDSAKPIVFRAFEPLRLTREQCREYEGTYISEELDTRYGIAAADSGLLVQIRRFDDLPLTPTVRDVFKYQDFRQFVFQRDGSQGVSGFLMSDARARNIRFVKESRTGGR